MNKAQRTLTLPRDGYGAEPRNDADLLLLAGARVQAALPAGWSVQSALTVGGGDRSTDGSLSLTRGIGPALTYDVEIKRIKTRDGLSAAVGKSVSDSAGRRRTILISRYFSPPQQDLLREKGVAYADATGNLFLSSDDPLILVSDRGATADPWRGPGRPTTSLKGLPAALLVRALTDYAPPYTVSEITELAGTSLGAAYRLVDYLTTEGLLVRAERGPITTVDWPELLRRWSQEARYLDTSTTRGFLEPRGLDNLVKRLAENPPASRYAVSGSLATQPYASYAEPRLGLIYADDPLGLASDLELRPIETGANVILAVPRSPVVFERATTWRDIEIVAPSQAVADLLGGPGRNPAEGEYLLEWMRGNTDAWRRKLDR